MMMTNCSILLLWTVSLSIAQAFVTKTPAFTRYSQKNASALVVKRQSRLFSTDDDDEIDVDSLGDWRAFRRSLQTSSGTAAISSENEAVLRSQNEVLANEYKTGVWAHETSMPEQGGLVCRMPLEVELHWNYKHSLIGKKLHSREVEGETTSVWYARAQMLVEEEMQEICQQQPPGGGAIDASSLNKESAEMLQLYIDNQETWQEVCLVIERDEVKGTATTVVINRPMAMKLTENLAQLVLNGAFVVGRSTSNVKRFMRAFGNECAVYVGGSQNQDEAALLLHGIDGLEGSTEVAPGIYMGGVEAAVEGVLSGKYQPLDFRFFVGRHSYQDSMLDVNVLLGKYQPIACARSLALKQCISLPKPLWHEVLELCGGQLREISGLELLKRDDLGFEIVEEDELEALDDDNDDNEDYYA